MTYILLLYVAFRRALQRPAVRVPTLSRLSKIANSLGLENGGHWADSLSRWESKWRFFGSVRLFIVIWVQAESFKYLIY